MGRRKDARGGPFENQPHSTSPLPLSPSKASSSSDDGSDSDAPSSSEEEDEEDESEDEPSSDDEPPPPRKKAASGGAAGMKAPPKGAAALATPAARAMAATKGPTYSPAPDSAAVSTAPAAGGTDGPERFAARTAERFPFLAPDAIRDAAGVRPGEPGYNPRTLRIPPGWFKAAKVTEAQRQWWEVKARHFDSTLLFKMGKFYEMFEMDATTGADVCGLAYMKGDQPHCGFPEAAYLGHAEKLARAGRRVVVVEQVETPAQLATRNEARKRAGLPKEAVVRRDVVSVLTAGTLTDPEMLATQPDAAWVVSLVEGPPPAGSAAADGATLGAAAVDAATGAVLVGSWVDGDVRAGLRALLAELRPAELVLPRAPLLETHGGGGGAAPPPSSPPPPLVLSPATDRALRASLPAWPRVNDLSVGSDFWDAPRTAAELGQARYFGGGAGGGGAAGDASPPVLAALLAAAPACPLAAAALAALGGAVSYLRSCLLDRTVLCLGRVEALPPVVGTGGEAASAAPPTAATPYPPSVAVDGAALDSLEVLANSAGGGAGSLLASVDHCATPAGRRRLRSWLCRPLGRPADIARRQDAVAALLARGSGSTAADAARAALAASTAACGDLERALARLSAAASPVGGGTGRDAAGVVLYEDAARRRVVALASALRGLRCVLDALAAVGGLADGGAGGVLADLGANPALAAAWEALGALEAAADWPAATAAGRVAPAAGVDPALDAADGALAAADAALAGHLVAERAALRAPGAALVSLHKDPHVLELADAVRVPPSYRLIGQRKGFRRYMSPALEALAAARAECVAGREEALGGVLVGLLSRFAASHAAWAATVSAASDLDALLSLAAAAELGAASGPMCRPEVVEASPPAGDPAGPPAQFLRAVALRHPAADALVAGGAAAAGVGAPAFAGGFVSNDVALGGAARDPPFLLLTGPNMGGKSTLLRQVCLAAMLAHAGGWVPAASFACTAVDAIFTRMGARDAILSGQSTFLVELAETAAALGRATPRSLVALDELGRGTATADGAAIAGAVLDHLATTVRCRGLFATHYHRLADEAAATGAACAGGGGHGGGGGAAGAGGHPPGGAPFPLPAPVGVYHMAADVRPDPAGGAAPSVTFLYKLARGACPASHGTNVARLAGMPPTVVDRAAAFAARLAAGEAFDGAVSGAGAAVAAAAALARRLKVAVAAGDGVGVAAARAAAGRLA